MGLYSLAPFLGILADVKLKTCTAVWGKNYVTVVKDSKGRSPTSHVHI